MAGQAGSMSRPTRVCDVLVRTCNACVRKRVVGIELASWEVNRGFDESVDLVTLLYSRGWGGSVGVSTTVPVVFSAPGNPFSWAIFFSRVVLVESYDITFFFVLQEAMVDTEQGLCYLGRSLAVRDKKALCNPDFILSCKCFTFQLDSDSRIFSIRRISLGRIRLMKIPSARAHFCSFGKLEAR